MEFVCRTAPCLDNEFLHRIEIELIKRREGFDDHDKNQQIPENHVIGRLVAFRMFQSEFMPSEITREQMLALDDESADLSDIANNLKEYGHEFEQLEGDYEDEWDIPGGFLVIDRLTIAPFARGLGLGYQLIEELRRQHSGIGMFVALQAAAYQIEDPQARESMNRRLVQYYTKNRSLKLVEYGHKTGFLMGYWPSENKQDRDYLNFDFEEKVEKAWQKAPESLRLEMI